VPTGLTFGTITSRNGLNARMIDRTQFSLLVAAVVLSAIVLTAVARQVFQPAPRDDTRDRRAVAARVALAHYEVRP